MSGTDLQGALVALVEEYRSAGQGTQLHDRLKELARSATPDALIVAAEPFRDDPSIVAPLYEVIVESQPNNARALVMLANALWLLGAGPLPVAELASRAIAADPTNRGAWHLWSLSESDPRARTRRWQQVVERFPGDDLALVNVADNAAAVASAEHDDAMLDLAVAAYEALRSRATEPAQRNALDQALTALRGWRM